MDSRDLKSASNYVNGQLASRGLIRGQPIDFANLSKDPETPGRILNLVYELVQRRDREADQRENLALTIRTLRSTETKQTSTIDTLKDKISDLERKNAVLEGQGRSLAAAVRTSESSAKSLRDETTRLKILLAQVRTQSANDIRKRDIQIQRMKERLLDTRRGTRPSASTIVVKGGNSSQPSRYDAPAAESSQTSKSMSDDTVDFLTTLSQNLADENDSILALTRQCLSALKAVQGLPDDSHNPQTEEEAEGAPNPVVAPPSTFESLSLEMDAVMGSLQEMLNQPSYVPIEELAERDEEIKQLKQRNDILHTEWKKAIDLVDGYNKGLIESVANSAGPPPPGVAGRSKGKGKLRASTANTDLMVEAQVLKELPMDQDPLSRADRRASPSHQELEPEAAPEPEAAHQEGGATAYASSSGSRLPGPGTREPGPVLQPQPPQPELEEPRELEPQAAQEEGEAIRVIDTQPSPPQPEPEEPVPTPVKEVAKRRITTRTRLPEPEPEEPVPTPVKEAAKRRVSTRIRLPEPEPEGPEPVPIKEAAKRRASTRLRALEPEPEREESVPTTPVRATPRRHVASRMRLPDPEPEGPVPVKEVVKRRASARVRASEPVPEPTPAKATLRKRVGLRNRLPEPEPEGDETIVVPIVVKETPRKRVNTRTRPLEPKPPQAEPEPVKQPATRRRASARTQVPEQEPEQEQEEEAEQIAESISPPVRDGDRVTYHEEVIVVRTKPPAPSPPRPRVRQQTVVVPEVETEPEDTTASKKRRRSTRAKPKLTAATTTAPTESPPVKKVKHRMSKRKEVDGDAALSAAFGW